MTNVLLQDWDTPFQIAPFDTISDEDFAPALDIALARHSAEIDAIAGADAPATFANTIEALEAVGRDLDKVLGTFYTVAGADSNPAREALQRDFSPKLAAHFAEISGNKALFARVAVVYASRDQLDLTDEQARVLMLTHRGFVRSGAALEGKDEARMKVIKGRLAELGTAFTQNLLADERDWFMELGEDDLAGLPDFVVNTARAAGEEKGADGPVVTLSRSLIVPFLQFSTRRDLREVAYKAWTARGANGGETDNRAIAAEILALREERAKLLGYENFAAYKLETEMAKTPQAVRDLLMSVWEPARAQANADAGVLEQMMVQDGVNGPLAPWDWRFYSERRRKELHDLDEAEVKPYFQLERMIEASFACASRLFGLEFRPLDIPLYHPDCRAWEVTRGGAHVAVFIGDYFARGSKRSGAWCSAMRAQAKYPEVQAPVVINVCNFAKGDPALLSYDDARTLFHEFGHALHQMLSNVTYESVSGTSVARDFVELPSQLYEHWLEVPEVPQASLRPSRHAPHIPAA
ncbi:MAG: M3 family metallopeptidase, partial [Pseudomonadota bacterium]